ncbi:MAG: hypothetical protein PHY09_03605 [Desulfuromonadaceae bacterium]|nr:hypothetical protein [Desulfuromonadaceae bacterium]MDD5104164.1 hypothetical protein [Desulfuromonadaceae bacterium]
MSNKFHVTIPDNDTVHTLSGYQEVIDTLLWGLREIGYEVSFSCNYLLPDARNIVLRADSASSALLETFPIGTIIYSLEQSFEMFLTPEKPKDAPFARIWESYRYIRQNFEVWDYSKKNIDAMLTIESKMPVKHVQIAYAPILQRIVRPQYQDIDVLIYGMPNDYRFDIFRKLSLMSIRCMFICGFYGSARDEMIGRAKIILNLSGEGIFTIVRASYLLANRKLVIADMHPDLHYEFDMLEAVKFCPTEHIPFYVQHWLSNDNARLCAENNGFDVISRRDIRTILQTALA